MSSEEAAKQLAGRVAVVTGSTSGIGLAIAAKLAAQGADVMINGFGPADAIEKERSNIEKTHGVRAWYNASDLSTEEGNKALVRDAIAKGGRIDILVNNAGIQHTAPLEQFPREKWDFIIALMLSAPFFAMQEAIPNMRANKWGRVVNIASVHGLVASVNKAAYVAAKHGLIGLTKVAALETARDGVTVNAICPGFVLTPLIQKQIDDIAAKEGISQDKAKERLLEAKQPSLDFVTPDDVAGLIAFLCSEPARQIRGAAYTIDGGWTAQ